MGTYEKRGHYEMVEKVGLILALCRFSLGICIHVLLFSLINYKIYIMAHDTENLAIFRGLLKFKSNVQKIWGVLIFPIHRYNGRGYTGYCKTPKPYGDVFRDENLKLDFHHSNNC